MVEEGPKKKHISVSIDTQVNPSDNPAEWSEDVRTLLQSLSSKKQSKSELFCSYFFHSGPLRCEAPSSTEWPERLPNKLCSRKNLSRFDAEIKGCSMLIEACQRAGDRPTQLSNSYFALGILFDNCGQKRSALKAYRKSLRAMESVAQSEQDTAHILNAIAVDYQALGDYGRALDYHLRHREHASAESTFIVHSNLGLLLMRCNQASLAYNQHCLALRFARKLQSKLAEAIAMSNLSLSSVMRAVYSDARAGRGPCLVKARACAERYLQLCIEVDDIQAQCFAFHNLGQISSEMAQLSDATYFFDQALAAARYINDARMAETIKVKMAVCKADLH